MAQIVSPSSDDAAMRVGLSLPLSGPGKTFGEQMKVALEIWAAGLNASGGLLGRAIELLIEDDQTNPAACADIYRKLIEGHAVDLLLGPYMTPQVEAALPVIAKHQRFTVSILATAANARLRHGRYFSMIGGGPDPASAISRGFFELASRLSPRPSSVALLCIDAGLGRAAREGALRNAAGLGMRVVSDTLYPADTTDFDGLMSDAAAHDAEILFAAALPRETASLIMALQRAKSSCSLIGGLFVGLNESLTKVALGPALNGIVSNEGFSPARRPLAEGAEELLATYQDIAVKHGLDPLGHGAVPFAFAAAQTLEAAVRATSGLDDEKLADWLHAHSVKTALGSLAFNEFGEWQDPGFLFVQYDDVQPDDLEQFRTGAASTLVWPT